MIMYADEQGRIQEAQNWTAETAGVIAMNARSFADETLSDISKKFSKVKNVASFFRFGLGSDNNNK